MLNRLFRLLGTLTGSLTRLSMPHFLPTVSTVAPIAAAYFQDAIGQFMAYNAFGQGQAMQPARPGGGYVPTQAPASNPNTDMTTTGPQGAQRNYG